MISEDFLRKCVAKMISVASIYLPEDVKEALKKAYREEENPIAREMLEAILENIEIAVGDTVYYKEFSGTETEFEGKKYLIIPYADILAKAVETEAI